MTGRTPTPIHLRNNDVDRTRRMIAALANSFQTTAPLALCPMARMSKAMTSTPYSRSCFAELATPLPPPPMPMVMHVRTRFSMLGCRFVLRVFRMSICPAGLVLVGLRSAAVSVAGLRTVGTARCVQASCRLARLNGRRYSPGARTVSSNVSNKIVCQIVC